MGDGEDRRQGLAVEVVDHGRARRAVEVEPQRGGVAGRARARRAGLSRAGPELGLRARLAGSVMGGCAAPFHRRAAADAHHGGGPERQPEGGRHHEAHGAGDEQGDGSDGAGQAEGGRPGGGKAEQQPTAGCRAKRTLSAAVPALSGFMAGSVLPVRKTAA